MKSIRDQIDSGMWETEESTLGVWALVSRIREILINLAKVTTAIESRSTRLAPIDVTLRRMSRGGGSQGSVRGSGSLSMVKPITPAPSRPLAREAPATSTLTRSKEIVPLKLTSVVDELPISLDAGEVTDFTTAKQMFESFWGVCSDCFVFNVQEKKPVNINHLHLSPNHWIICKLEPKGVKLAAHYLSHMPDLSSRQTICIMPKDLPEKPTSWDEIKDGQFWIINGQHNVEAAKSLQDSGLPEDRLTELRTWNAFVVWTKDAKLLRRISQFYNRCNHFGMFQPTWGTNVIGARHIWTKLGRPTNPKDTCLSRKGATKSPLKCDVKNERNHKEFYKAVQLQFANIEVNASKKLFAKSTSKTAGNQKLEDKLNIRNEIKIITADDTTFDLWSEVISAHSTGELIDPDSMKKFKDTKGWKPEKDGQLNREFFKWMGNLSSSDHRKLALHLLNRSGDKRLQAYPKVTMKKIYSVLESCYVQRIGLNAGSRNIWFGGSLTELIPS